MRAFLLVLCLIGGAAHAADPTPLAETEALFLQFLDARDAVAYLNSGHVTQYEGGNVDAWDAKLRDRHQALLGSLAALNPAKLSPEDQAAVAAIRVTLADFGDPSPAVANAPDDPECKDRNSRKLDYEALSAALSSCYREIGNQLKFEDGTIDRGSALGLLYDLEEPERRKALFDAFRPLWSALNGNNEPDSPYRRLIRMAAAAEATNGSGVEAAARPTPRIRLHSPRRKRSSSSSSMPAMPSLTSIPATSRNTRAGTSMRGTPSSATGTRRCSAAWPR